MKAKQEERLQLARDKLTDEQLAELDFVTELVRQSTDARRITYKGQTYYTFIYRDGGDDEQRAMRVIVGTKGWTISPADMPIKECLNYLP